MGWFVLEWNYTFYPNHSRAAITSGHDRDDAASTKTLSSFRNLGPGRPQQRPSPTGVSPRVDEVNPDA